MTCNIGVMIGKPLLDRRLPNVVDRLKAMRRPGEGYSDVILRLVAAGDGMEGA